MPRVKLTEYRAKKLIIGDTYAGVSIVSNINSPLPEKGNFVVKVDQGVKRRMKQGLVGLNKTPEEALALTKEWEKKGFSRFLMEPMLSYKPEDERYLSLERVREGIRLLYARAGGIEIESNPEQVKTYVLTSPEDSDVVVNTTDIPAAFLKNLVDVFEKNFFSFLEINPLVVRGSEATPLDAAVLVDSAGVFFVKGAWGSDDVVTTPTLNGVQHESEKRIAALAATTAASLKLNVINPDGSLFFLLSGGGGSIVIADEAQVRGFGHEIANYGEYSGGPTREETYLYAKEVIGLILASRAPKKALVISGGIANFTDIKSTFAGIIDALTENAEMLRTGAVKVFVRRGGPNEAAGLEHMRTFLESEDLLGTIAGSHAPITKAVDDAITYIQS